MSRVRHLAQDRLQDLQSLQEARPRGLERPVSASGALRQPTAAADRGVDRHPQARQAALGRPQDPRASGPPPRWRYPDSGQKHDPRRSPPPRPGQGDRPASPSGHRNPRCPRALSATSCGAPTSRASSSWATANTVTRSPSPTTPRASCSFAKPLIDPRGSRRHGLRAALPRARTASCHPLGQRRSLRQP